MSAFFDTLSTILQILGSLGVFLFGMKVMSEGVQKVAGAGMRWALARLTGNRWSGILTGFATTSATLCLGGVRCECRECHQGGGENGREYG